MALLSNTPSDYTLIPDSNSSSGYRVGSNSDHVLDWPQFTSPKSFLPQEQDREWDGSKPFNILQRITFPSIYKVNGSRVPVPQRMAWCTPDLAAALFNIQGYLQDQYPESRLVLSDLYRSYDMQLQAHLDYTSGKKKAYSPPPGGSVHEAGRAFDLSLDDLLKKPLNLGEFWSIAKTFGVVPIIDRPVSSHKEAWHFECRGSHQRVYDYYRTRLTHTNMSPYEAMVTSMLLDTGHYASTRLGIRDDQRRNIACLQAALIRVGHNPGVIDGWEGPRTREAVSALMSRNTYGFKYNASQIPSYLFAAFNKLQGDFRAEYFSKTPDIGWA